LWTARTATTCGPNKQIGRKRFSKLMIAEERKSTSEEEGG